MEEEIKIHHLIHLLSTLVIEHPEVVDYELIRGEYPYEKIEKPFIDPETKEIEL